MLKLVAVPALAGALCCAFAPAVASPGAIDSVTVTGGLRGVVRTQIVSLRDLDLRQTAEVSRAESRIRFASKQVCDPSAIQGLYQRRDYAQCFGAALSSARSDLGRYVALARAN